MRKLFRNKLSADNARARSRNEKAGAEALKMADVNLSQPSVRPKVRSLEPVPLDEDGTMRIALKDSANLGEGTIVLTPYAFQLTTLMDGTRTPAQICQAFETLTGQHLESELLTKFIGQLDASYALDNERSRGLLQKMVDRPCVHQGGAYPADPQELKVFLDGILDAVPPPPDRPIAIWPA